MDVAKLLRESGIRPAKSLGQNFLVDDQSLHRIIKAAQIANTDTVLEIGPGLGSLTRYLALSAHEVIAVEIDKMLVPTLRKVIKEFKNIKVIEGDILKLSVDDLVKSEKFLVVANIPYYITSAIIRHLLKSDHKPERMVLTVQKEVAQRICARPGDMSLLALSIQIYGKPGIVENIPASAFYPVPDVDSAVIRLDLFQEPLISLQAEEDFFILAKAGFSQKRKTLRNSLSAGLAMSTFDTESLLAAAGIDPKRRAETLSVSEWLTLTKLFKGHK